MYITMTKRMTMAKARRDWAKVLRTAERGTPVQVTRNGHPVAAVVSIEALRKIEGASDATLSEVLAELRAAIDPRDLEGPDPWALVRDQSVGRDADID